VAVGGSDAMISLWDTKTWVCRRTVSSASSGPIRGLSWSWDGRYIVGASEEVSSSGGAVGGGGSEAQGLEIYHAESGEVVHTIPTGGAGVPAVAWHPSRYWLAYTVVDETRSKAGGSGLRIVSGPSM
jgi:THO complex subunit 3